MRCELHSRSDDCRRTDHGGVDDGSIGAVHGNCLESSAHSIVHEPLTERLRRHVAVLAGDIGERNVFRPSALHAAADYIRAEWANQGHEVASQWYEVQGVTTANLAIELRGKSKPDEIVLIGAHYDSVHGSSRYNRILCMSRS